MDGAIQLWATGSHKPLRSLTQHAGPVKAIAVQARGRVAASAGSDGTVRLWWTGSGKLRRVLKGHTGEVLDVAFSPNGQRVATACADGALRIFSTSSGRLLKTVPELYDTFSGGVEYSPDGRKLSAVGFDGKIHFFHAVSGRPMGELPAPYSRINVYSADGRHIILGGHTNAPQSRAFVAMLNATNGALIWQVFPDDDSTLSLALSPDGGLIASGGTSQNIPNGTIKLWRTSDGFLVRTLESHSVEINSLCFSADGAHLISTETRAVKVWRVADGALLSAYTREIEGIGACARIPASSSFIYGRFDGTVVRADLVEPLME
jgi:WD40 repeat protein